MNNRNKLSPSGELKLIVGPNSVEASTDITVASRLLRYTVANTSGTFARIYRPKPTVAFTSRDYSTAGFQKAQYQARKLGFEPVLRSPGGRAVAYHEDSVVLDLVSNDPDPHALINERFLAIAEVFVETFERLGIKSTVGAVPREYCPGKYSVITKNVKLVGTAQRIMRGGWLLSAFVIVRNVAPIREVLTNVYRELCVDMDPSTVSGLSEFESNITMENLSDSLIASLKERFEFLECELSLNESGNFAEKVSA